MKMLKDLSLLHLLSLLFFTVAFWSIAGIFVGALNGLMLTVLLIGLTVGYLSSNIRYRSIEE